jgi:hypothetical protein
MISQEKGVLRGDSMGQNQWSFKTGDLLKRGLICMIGQEKGDL